MLQQINEERFQIARYAKYNIINFSDQVLSVLNSLHLTKNEILSILQNPKTSYMKLLSHQNNVTSKFLFNFDDVEIELKRYDKKTICYVIESVSILNKNIWNEQAEKLKEAIQKRRECEYSKFKTRGMKKRADQLILSLLPHGAESIMEVCMHLPDEDLYYVVMLFDRIIDKYPNYYLFRYMQAAYSRLVHTPKPTAIPASFKTASRPVFAMTH